MKNPWKLVVMTLAVSLGVAAGTNGLARAEPEPQSHMRAALDTLRAAERQLEKSNQDDAGHRSRALLLTKDAIDQLEKALPREQSR